MKTVIEGAKKTGDYSVLSHADLCVLALTYALDLAEKQETEKLAASQVSVRLLRCWSWVCSDGSVSKAKTTFTARMERLRCQSQHWSAPLMRTPFRRE